MSRLEKLKEFLAADPADAFTKYAIGLEYMSLKDYPAAIAAFEELRTADPAYIPTYYQLAESYRIAERLTDAMTICRAGITAARSAGDLHAASELQALLDDIEEES